MKKEDAPQHSNEKGKWLLVCPDFPQVCISDESLDETCWNTAEMMERARHITELALRGKMLNGDTIPGAQKELPGFFSFRVVVGYDDEDISDDF